MSKILKNNTGSDVTLHGYVVPGSGQLTIDPGNYQLFSRSDLTITKLSDGTLTMNDGSTDLALAAGIQYLQGGFNTVSVHDNPPFAAKKIDGKSIFNRTHGKPFSLSVGANDGKVFEVPYPQVKFNGIEIIGGEKGDYCELKVLDTDGDPDNYYPYGDNFQLNQFGFSVYVAPDFFRRESRYDADLLLGMQIGIDYNSQSAKTIYVNYLLHELK